MKAQYNIEEAKYENEMLLIKGWIICGREKNLVDKLRLIVVSASGLEKCFELKLFDRIDVAECLGLKYENAGFSFRNVVKSFHSAKVYLEYEFFENVKRIKILEIWGEEKNKKNERLVIGHPEENGFCSVENLEDIRFTNYKWKEITNREVDVIIPVYNGYNYFDKLFSSIFNTSLRMRVIVINDCSSDERVLAYLDELSAKFNNIILINNETNLGFLKSVNKGLALSKNHVALVNTDVEVPENWLERLLYPIFNDKTVASTTPYTNCGTICSFPELGSDSSIFDNRSVFFVDSIFRDFNPSYTEMPTGVGFCMGMSRNAIKKVGMFDEENFGRGYAEENDWCQRAIEMGFKNVHVENLFVYHRHGGSFQSEEKKKLLETNIKRLEAKHPRYLEDVSKFFEFDKNRYYRTYALFLCIMQINKPSNLFFNHVLGGGANDYMLTQIEKLINNNEKCIEFSYNVYSGYYQAIISYKNYIVRLHADTMDRLLAFVKLGDINNIYVNELVTYPEIDKVLKKIVELKNATGANMVMLGHDYYFVCPTINLLNKYGKYCYLDCNKDCDCLQSNKYIANRKYTSIEKWHSMWSDFMKSCDSIIVFSNDSKKIFEQVYGIWGNLKVVPHKTERMLKIEKQHKLTDTFNIAILGVLSDRKGLKIVKDMLKCIEKEKLPLAIVIIGECEEDINEEHCLVTGRYTREQLPSLMYLYDIDLVFISSVWPETFSFTTEEAIKMNMPVAVFNLGAPVERIRKYDKGFIIDNMSAECAINTIYKYAKSYERPKVKGKSVLFVIERKSFSSRYRVEHFREHLAYIGIASKMLCVNEVDFDKISEYVAISVYRCSDVNFINKIADATRRNGQKLLYDLDDFIFEYNKISHLDFLKGRDYNDFYAYSKNICSCMAKCDILTTSTITLAQEMKHKFPDKQVIVHRNTACMEMQLLSEIAVDNNDKSSSDKVILGYFSGSHTHNNDWMMIENVICDIMEKDNRVELMLVGALETSTGLSQYKERIIRIPFGDWRKLPKLIRSIDINLMPLENELFNWCKSENKWMEAGLVGIPTVVSRNPELERVMTDHVDAIFCDNEVDWKECIVELINNLQLRQTIGNNAKNIVYNTHLVDSEANYRKIVNILVN